MYSNLSDNRRHNMSVMEQKLDSMNNSFMIDESEDGTDYQNTEYYTAPADILS